MATEPPARLTPATSRPVTLADSSVILDIVTEDHAWGERSADALAQALDDGPLVINPIVHAEVSAGFDRIEDLDDAVPADDLKREALPYEAGFLAGKAFLAYRRGGGQKRSPLPDFYIGAHAAVRGYRLLTRDAARYRLSHAAAARRGGTRHHQHEQDGGEGMLTEFYVAFGTVCFTLLGLWMVVLQTRHAEWRGVPVHRRRAYGVALHFSLPGLMTLLSLIDPASMTLWRVSFAIVAAGGAIVLVLVRGSLPSWAGLAAYLAAVALYVLIAVVAAVPSVVTDVGISALPLRVEAVLLTILVFFGANVALLLLFEETSQASNPASR